MKQMILVQINQNNLIVIASKILHLEENFDGRTERKKEIHQLIKYCEYLLLIMVEFC
jgi:hypothetical protein